MKYSPKHILIYTSLGLALLVVGIFYCYFKTQKSAEALNKERIEITDDKIKNGTNYKLLIKVFASSKYGHITGDSIRKIIENGNYQVRAYVPPYYDGDNNKLNSVYYHRIDRFPDKYTTGYYILYYWDKGILGINAHWKYLDYGIFPQTDKY